MALTNTCLRFLVWAKENKVSFQNTLTLGHLDNLVTKQTVTDLVTKHPGTIIPEHINWNDKYADSIITSLGAEKVSSLDKSDYEQADIIHDLNTTLPSSHFEKYSLIIDGGTLEHVFNFPVAINNCMQALRTGGHFIGFSPANNLMGHGFYQFSPELFFRVFSAQNNFKIKGLFLVAAPFSVDAKIWYEVKDPDLINERVILNNRFPVYMMVLAEKLGQQTGTFTVYQSDYVSAWNKHPAIFERTVSKKPFSIKILLKQILGLNKNQEDLEKINPGFFTKKMFE